MRLTILASLLGLAYAALAPSVEEPRTHTIKLNGHTFTLPVGFTVELAAGHDLVPRPITADFDDQGRLYVADSSGSNEKVAAQLEKLPHRILRLTGTKGSGTFDKVKIFAERMMFPEGTLWHDGALYVAAPPSIWKLTETKSGVERQEWFQGKTLTGCANDLHGPYLGPDGWIYWAKGAFAEQTYQRPDGKPFVTKASHLFRCQPDGSGLEPIMTGGMDNPVDVAFLPNGERFFTTTFLQHPAGGLRDGILHAVYGGLHGKVHNVLDGHPWTAPTVMPVLSHLGAAAPCGLTRYEGSAFGAEFRDNLFACQFNLRKVSRHILTQQGAGYISRDEDFLVSDNLDFHPTDVIEDADGSLLVIDTGGWYKLCCPTSQLDKPDILGGIYRVRKKDAPKIDDPRGLNLDWTAPAKYLDDPRPAVRRRALVALRKQDEAALPALRKALLGNEEQRRNALWALHGIQDRGARKLVREALKDTDPGVRQVALHGVSLWRDRAAAPLLPPLLAGTDPLNQRLAAECLGRIGDPAAVPHLLTAAANAPDRERQHAICYALIEIGATAEIERVGLTRDNPATLRTALVALDNIPGYKLAAQHVLKHLGTKDAALRENLLWIAGRHPEWGPDLAGYLREQLAGTANRADLQRLLTRFAKSEAIQTLIAEKLRAKPTKETRALLLASMADSGLKEPPETWTAALAELLTLSDPDTLAEVIQTIPAFTIPRLKSGKLHPPLLAIAENPRQPEPLRLAAFAALPGGAIEVSPPLLDLARKYLAPDQPLRERSLAVTACSQARLSNEQLLVLADSLRTVGPLEVDRLLEAFARSTDARVGLAALAALEKSETFGGLRIDMLRPRLAKYPANVQQKAETLYARINADAAKQKEKLDTFLAAHKDGDIRRGQAVFHSPRAACAACHALGYLGGKTGPDLTRIGAIRSERDLLESILFPSASLVRSYEPVLVTTRAGKTFNGLILRETPDEIELATGPTQKVRLARGDIEELAPSRTSVMPGGLDQVLTPQELADLLAFLKSRK